MFRAISYINLKKVYIILRYCIFIILVSNFYMVLDKLHRFSDFEVMFMFIILLILLTKVCSVLSLDISIIFKLLILLFPFCYSTLCLFSVFSNMSFNLTRINLLIYSITFILVILILVVVKFLIWGMVKTVEQAKRKIMLDNLSFIIWRNEVLVLNYRFYLTMTALYGLSVKAVGIELRIQALLVIAMFSITSINLVITLKNIEVKSIVYMLDFIVLVIVLFFKSPVMYICYLVVTPLVIFNKLSYINQSYILTRG